MTDASPHTHYNEFANGLPVLAHADAPSDDDLRSIEKIVAAILGDNHAMSTEQLSEFEDLLDAPDMDAGKRQELLQTLWNIVVCIIDFQWDVAPCKDASISCESNTKRPDPQPSERPDMVEWGPSDCGKIYNEAAADKPRRKGSP